MVTMNITVDKELTPRDVRTDIKEQAKAFKMLYSPERLRDMFANTILANDDRKIMFMYGDIIACNASVYQGGNFGDVLAHFQIKMTVDSGNFIFKVKFYMDYDGNVNTEVIRFKDGTTMNMWDVDVFELV